MDAMTRTYLRRERDRLVRLRIGPTGGKPLTIEDPWGKRRPSHWPKLIVVERSGRIAA